MEQNGSRIEEGRKDGKKEGRKEGRKDAIVYLHKDEKVIYEC